MKKIFLAAGAILVSSLLSQAQIKEGTRQTGKAEYLNNRAQPKTLIGSKIYSSGYGTLSTQYSKFNHQDAMFLGAYGGWMINHKLMIGGGGYGLVTKHKGFGTNPMNKQNELRMGYGGLMVEYTFGGNKLIHVTANTLIGAGGITNGYAVKDNWDDEDDWKNVKASAFFVAQPGVNVEVNVTKWFRIGAGGSYRFIAGNSLPGISSRDMSAPAANLSFAFGEF